MADSMAAVHNCSAWAEYHIPLLQKMLDEPNVYHNVRDLLSPDGVCIAHVLGLVGLLSTQRGGPWGKHFDGRATRAVALHLWLYHLGGGADAKLRAPTMKAADSKALLNKIEGECSSYTIKLRELKVKRTRRVERAQSTEDVDSSIATLLDGILQPFNWRLVRVGAPVPAAGGGGGGGAPVLSDEVKANLRDLRSLIAKGVSTRASPLHSLMGQDDVLFNICDLACIGGMCVWLPTPHGVPLLEARRHLYLEHSKVIVLTQQLGERDAAVSELQQELARAGRREEHAMHLSDEARRTVQRVRDDEEERLKVCCCCPRPPLPLLSPLPMHPRGLKLIY